ncbi:hypothetical protein [Cetobacterium sp.]|uniref:hypothetical protein n=1 Tax=Cetobacterium sp. TaxID=2071632 RepID=UPI003F2F70A6
MGNPTFVTFDLQGKNDLYDEFYEEARKYNFFKYVPGKYTSSKKDASLPNTTLFKYYLETDGDKVRNLAREEISKIYQKFNLKGISLVIVAKHWGSNSF